MFGFLQRTQDKLPCWYRIVEHYPIKKAVYAYRPTFDENTQLSAPCSLPPPPHTYDYIFFSILLLFNMLYFGVDM